MPRPGCHIRVWIRRGAVILIALGVTLHAARAAACSCAPVSPSEALARSDNVLRGKVTGIREAWGNAIPPGLHRRLPLWLRPDQGRLIDLEVTGVWKGRPNARQVVFTGFGGGDCGLPASVGDEWLVYGWAWGSEVASGICSGSGPVAARSGDLAVLGAPSPSGAPARRSVIYLALFAALVVSAGFAARQLSRS